MLTTDRTTIGLLQRDLKEVRKKINVGPTVKYQSILTESKVFNEEHFFFSAQNSEGDSLRGMLPKSYYLHFASGNT